jgi:hypothetical protein
MIINKAISPSLKPIDEAAREAVGRGVIMKYAIAIAGMMWVGNAWALPPCYDDGRMTPYNCESSRLVLPNSPIEIDDPSAVYSTPAPKRNWNLFILDSVTLTPHLYKEECEAMMGWVKAKDLGLHPECFETPK